MAGKIHYYDTYDLRKFLKISPYCIDGLIDIGANVGSVSILGRMLFPDARVVGLEPCKETYNILERNMRYWRIETYNVAIGDGKPMCFIRRGGSGYHRFIREDEDQWMPEKPEYFTESLSLRQIFDTYKLNDLKSYIIKIDTEGGERHLFNKESMDIIKGCVQFMAELHSPFGGTVDEWNEWANEFKDTHELRLGMWKDKGTSYRRSIYVPIDEIPRYGTAEIMLVNKEWVCKYRI